MKKYKIAVSWGMSAELEIEADSLQSAIDEVYDDPDLPQGEYISCSFEVNEEFTEYLNGEKIDEKI